MRVCVRVIGRSPALAAGVTFTRTSSAPWRGRWQHTTVIDAAGAIYVIGGFDGNTGTYHNDVWVSTDGGADRTRAGGGRVEYAGATKGVLSGQ